MKTRKQKSDREQQVEQYRCQKCGKDFDSREDLLKHEEVHRILETAIP